MDLRNDAIAIWQAGVRAVDSEELVRQSIHWHRDSLSICGESIPLAKGAKIEVVGAGKAGAGMTRGLLKAFADLPTEVSLSGWVNVPEDCVEDAAAIKLFAARPAGVNEPTEKGVEGTREILSRVASLTKNDLCIVLISGGGSALLPAPVPQISLADKLAVTRVLAQAGLPIEQLNTVRSQLSEVKGGGLAKACRARHIVTLIISDVIGDPLQSIASGPTVPAEDRPQDALDILLAVDPDRRRVPRSVYSYLESQCSTVQQTLPSPAPTENVASQTTVRNHVIGSNRVAVAAAETEARRRGYEVINLGSDNCGNAGQLGVSLMNQLVSLRDNRAGQQSAKPFCVLAGGETTVELAKTDSPRKGGRNQEVVLAAINAFSDPCDWKNTALLSGGTDGEDGPTDAAGAIADETAVQQIAQHNLNSGDYLKVNNSYPFLHTIDALLKTGPTHTNVMDLAVGLTVSGEAD